jgi:GT2 family glycosyltransferase
MTRPRPVLAPPPAEPPRAALAPTFSAIVAAYQAAAYIGDAIESLLGQTRPLAEIIVCDDGSTDDLGTVLEDYSDRITVLRKENGGEASAKNAAARAASGDFLAILDADDVYYPERLEALAELSVARPDLDILTADSVIVLDGRPVRRCYGGTYHFEVEDQRRGILERNFVGPGHMAVRRRPFVAVGGFDESFRHATDWDCWIRMIFAGSRVGMVDQPLAEYRVRETSLASQRVRQLEAYVAVLEKAELRNDLDRDERRTLAGSLGAQRRRLALRRVEDAVIEGRPDARRLAITVVRDARFPLGTRAKAAVAAAAPRLAASWVARRGRELAAGIRL